jgi:transcriptional regulator with XRE-family HTH domain
MGSARRPQPAKLAKKLLQIRRQLGLSQGQMFKRLENCGASIYAPHISGYESGTREPPLPVLLRYAELAGVSTDVLINDKLSLPK